MYVPYKNKPFNNEFVRRFDYVTPNKNYSTEPEPMSGHFSRISTRDLLHECNWSKLSLEFHNCVKFVCDLNKDLYT